MYLAQALGTGLKTQEATKCPHTSGYFTEVPASLTESVTSFIYNSLQM